MASERLGVRGERRIQGLLWVGDPYGEVRDAWYAKEGVRDIYQIGCPELAAEFTQQLSGDVPGPVTPTGGELSRAHHRSLGHPDHELAPFGRYQRTHRRTEQSHQEDPNEQRSGSGTSPTTESERFLYAGKPNWQLLATITPH